MRCPNCETPNPDTDAYCISCGQPMNAYASAGEVGELGGKALARLAAVSVRPGIVRIAAVFDLVLVLLYPVWSIISRVSSRTQLNSETTNYVGAAFGAVNVAVTAMGMLPLAGALLWVGWASLNQRSWAWWANLGVFVWVAFAPSAAPAPLRFIAMGAMVWFWVQPRTREWFGCA